jgi:hypothetical protein
MSATCEELFDENEALLADAELMAQHLAEAAECTKELLARAEAAEARVAELEQYIDSNTTERDGVRYSKSVAFEGCAKCTRSGAAAERTAVVEWLRSIIEYAAADLASQIESGAHHLQARNGGSDE